MNAQQKIGELVAHDYRAAAVFKKYKIDFCCNGGRSIEEACNAKHIHPETLLNELEEATLQPAAGGIDFQAWDADLLIDYIEKKHHRYVDETIPVLLQYLNKLEKVHGPQHPELLEIRQEFEACAGALTAHMKKEELVLFPYIRSMEKSKRSHLDPPVPHFGTVENPIRMMLHEHDTEGERFRRIAALTSDYMPPADACNTYRVAYQMLRAFEEDLHTHIHLENNILFPKAKKMETSLHTSTV